MPSLESIALSIVGVGLFWAFVAMWIFWRRPALVWWRTVRPRRRVIRQKYRTLVKHRAQHAANVLDAKRLPEQLKQAWIEDNKTPPLDHLRDINGVGDGTLDVLRQHGVRGIGDIRSSEQLTKFKGIGPQKASMLWQGRQALLDTWQIELERQYYEEILPTQHAAQIESSKQNASLSQEALDALALTDLTGIRRRLFRGRLLLWLIKPIDDDVWDEIDARLDHAMAIIGVGHSPRQLTHQLNAVWAEPVTKRLERLIAEHGSKTEAWLHILRTHYSPTEFEVFTAQVWRALGYEVSLTPASGDHGADLIAVKGGERIAIECKRYAAKGSVGNVHIRGVAAHKSDQENPATHAMLVTTGRFTPKAYEAAEKFGVELIGPDELGALMVKTQTQPDLSRAL